jgi:mannan polymerase II complex ANP1 subunit
MPRHSAFSHGHAAYKRNDDEAFSIYPNRSDLENKYIWGLHDLVDDEQADARPSRRFEPRRSAVNARRNLYRILALVAASITLFTFLVFPSTRHFLLITHDDTPALEHFDIETLRYYDLEEVQGTSRGWEREERILLCTPLRDAESHLHMFFSHLRNFTYPHHLVDLAFLVSDSKDKTEEVLSHLLEMQQADPDPVQPYGEISVIHKDFGQKVNQDVESRHGFAAQAGRRKLMAQARNWLLSAALRPYHSWVYWRDADVETCPYTVLEDLMRHDKDIIVPSMRAHILVSML